MTIMKTEIFFTLKRLHKSILCRIAWINGEAIYSLLIIFLNPYLDYPLIKLHLD